MDNKKNILTNADILESQGLVEMYDPMTGEIKQVKKEDAQKMIDNLEKIKSSMQKK